MKLNDIYEDGKVVVALWIAEITLKDINEKNEDYEYCRKSVDLGWEWLISKNISKNRIMERISNHGSSISDIVVDIEDIELANKYGAILICLSYIAWQAYNYEKDYFYPQDLEGVNDEYLEELINELIEEKTIEYSKYEKVINYIKEKSEKDNLSIIKENIYAML